MAAILSEGQCVNRYDNALKRLTQMTHNLAIIVLSKFIPVSMAS